MFTIVLARLKQKKRTIVYPGGKLPVMPEKFRGRPVVTKGCPEECSACVDSCPVGALAVTQDIVSLDMGKCIYCHKCEESCGQNHIRFTRNHQTAAARRGDLVITPDSPVKSEISDTLVRKFFSKSLKLRQVSAGGCAACEADCNVLGTPAWDMGRFGIQFVASPRHADGILVTGPVTRNMHYALLKTYDALPEPRIVIACGACAISGGLFHDHDETHGGLDSLFPVNLYIPGCPPHPLTILDGLLRLQGRKVIDYNAI